MHDARYGFAIHDAGKIRSERCSRKGAKGAKEGVFGDWLLFCIVKSCLSPWFEKEAPDGDRQRFRGKSSLSPLRAWRLGAMNHPKDTNDEIRNTD
jgi:hypothetical protein